MATTRVDLTEEQREMLQRLARARGASTDELVAEALDEYIDRHHPSSSSPSNEMSDTEKRQEALDAAQGMWKDRSVAELQEEFRLPAQKIRGDQVGKVDMSSRIDGYGTK